MSLGSYADQRDDLAMSLPPKPPLMRLSGVCRHPTTADVACVAGSHYLRPTPARIFNHLPAAQRHPVAATTATQSSRAAV